MALIYGEKRNVSFNVSGFFILCTYGVLKVKGLKEKEESGRSDTINYSDHRLCSIMSFCGIR